MAFAIRRSLSTLRAIRIQSVFCRNITMSARLRAEEAIEEMKKKNPYFEKYASKLAALQQSSPEEFLGRLESVEKKGSTKKTKPER